MDSYDPQCDNVTLISAGVQSSTQILRCSTRITSPERQKHAENRKLILVIVNKLATIEVVLS